MSFRPARAGDTPVLREMMARSNGYEAPDARRMIETYAATWDPGERSNGPVWVMQDGEDVAGFHRLIPWGAQDLELDLFFTANARQGQGAGRRLFEHMRGEAHNRGATRVLIVSNPSAAGFYRRMGACDDGVQPPSTGVTWERPRLLLRL